MEPMNVLAKFEVALLVPEIIAIEVLGGVVNLILGRGGRRGSGWYRSKERW